MGRSPEPGVGEQGWEGDRRPGSVSRDGKETGAQGPGSRRRNAYLGCQGRAWKSIFLSTF